MPVVERELRIAARGKAVHRWRIAVVGIGLGIMTLMALEMTSKQMAAEIQGGRLFQALLTIAGVYAFAAGVSVTADTVSREKREGTLGLLFLTDLRGVDIVLGKLAANSFNTVYGLVGLAPLLAIPIMLGGVSIATGVLSTLAVLNLMFVSLSLGIFVSSLSWDERRATFAAFVLGLVVLLGPPMAAGLGPVFGRPGPGALFISSLSPLHALAGPATEALLTSARGPVAAATPTLPFGWAVLGLWIREAATLIGPAHLLGWVFLIAASRTAARAWQSRGGAPVKRTIDERLFTPRTAAGRAGTRRRLLDAHPLVWLLERHPAKRYYGDGLVLAMLLIWAWGYRSYGTEMFGGPSWFLIMPLAVVIHLIFASWVVAEASMRILADRRSGALELLLCTPLTDASLIGGHRLALRRLFLRPVLLMAAAEVFIGFTGFGGGDDVSARNGRTLMVAMATALVLDTYALSWIALRLSVSLTTVNRVGMYGLAITPLSPLVLATIAGFAIPPQRAGNSTTFVIQVTVWLACVALVDLVVGRWYCRRAVLREFREAAARVQPRAAVSA